MIATQTQVESDGPSPEQLSDSAPTRVTSPAAHHASPNGQPDILEVINELEDELVRCDELRVAAERRAEEADQKTQTARQRDKKLCKHIAAMNKKINSLEHSVHPAQGDRSQVESDELRRLRTENVELRDQVRHAKEQSATIRKVVAERDALTQSAAKIRAKLVDNEKRLETLEKKRGRLDAELGAANGRATAAETACKRAQEAVLSGTQTAEQAQNEADDLRTALKDKDAAVEQAVALRDKAGAQLKQVCGALKAAKASQKTAVARAEAGQTRAAALAAELEENAAARNRLEKKLATAGSAQQHSNAELTSVRAQLVRNRASESQVNERVQELESRLREMQSERTELLRGLNEADGALGETRVERDRLDEQLRQTQEMLDQSNAAKADAQGGLRKEGRRVAELQESAAELDETLRRTEFDLNDVASQRDQLRAQLESAQTELADAKAARQDAEASAAAKGERLKQLQSVVDDAFARQIESLTSANASLSGRVAQIERENAGLSEEKSSVELEVKSLQAEKRTSDENFDQMQQAVSELRSVLTVAGSRFARAMQSGDMRP